MEIEMGTLVLEGRCAFCTSVPVFPKIRCGGYLAGSRLPWRSFSEGRSPQTHYFLFVLFEFIDEGGSIDDLDAVVVLEVSQVGIPRDDVVGIFLQGAGQEFIVGPVGGNPVGFIKVLCDNGFSENQPEKPPHRFFFGFKAFFDPGIAQHAADLFDDLNRGNQFKVLVDPQDLKLGRQRVFCKQTADKKVCIDHRPEFTLQK